MILLYGYPKVACPRDSNCNFSHLLFLKSKLFSWMVLSFQENWVETIESFQIPSPPISLTIIQSSSVHSLSHVWFSVTPSTAARQASLSITNSRSLLKLMPIESVMPSNHLILCHPSPPALNLSQYQGLFQWVSSSHQVAKVLEFQLQHQSFQ